MGFNVIDMETWPRRSHYEYYMNQVRTSFQVTKFLDVSELVSFCRESGIRFQPAMIYLIMKGINSMPEFRMALDREGRPGYYDVAHAQYTVFHEDDKTFSDLWTYYDENPYIFCRAYMKDVEEYKDARGIKVKPGRPEMAACISCVPWLSFDAICFDTPGPGPFFLPIINFGRYEEKDGRLMMPFAVYINHAAADGYHVSKLINGLQSDIDSVRRIFDKYRGE